MKCEFVGGVWNWERLRFYVGHSAFFLLSVKPFYFLKVFFIKIIRASRVIRG